MCVAASVPTHKKRVEHTWVYIKTPAAPPGGRPSSPRPRPPQPPPRPLHTPSPQQHPPTPLLANHLDHLARATRVPGLTLCGVRIRGGDERAARCGAPSRPSQGRAFGRPATTAHPQLHLLTDRAHLRSTDNRACQSRRWRQRGRRQAAGQTPAGAAGADGAAAAPAGAALPWPRPPAPPPRRRPAASAGSWAAPGSAPVLHKDTQTELVQNEEDEGKTDRQGTQNTQTTQNTQNTQNPTAVIAAGERAVRAYQHWQPHPHRPAWPHPCTQLCSAHSASAGSGSSSSREARADEGRHRGRDRGSGRGRRRRLGGAAAVVRGLLVQQQLCCGNGEQSLRAHPQCAAGPRGSTHTRPSGRVKWAKAEQARGTAAWAVSG